MNLSPQGLILSLWAAAGPGGHQRHPFPNTGKGPWGWGRGCGWRVISAGLQARHSPLPGERGCSWSHACAPRPATQSKRQEARKSGSPLSPNPRRSAAKPGTPRPQLQREQRRRGSGWRGWGAAGKEPSQAGRGLKVVRAGPRLGPRRAGVRPVHPGGTRAVRGAGASHAALPPLRRDCRIGKKESRENWRQRRTKRSQDLWEEAFVSRKAKTKHREIPEARTT